MMNAMYFTSLVPQMEGVDGWPEQLRRGMAPDLLAELDALYNFPAGDPGIMGILGDNLFAHPELWGDIESLISYVRTMPPGPTGTRANPGIQGLIHEATFRYPEDVDGAEYAGLAPRDAIEQRMQSLDDRDTGEILAVFDRPEDLRARMVRLIERFYEEHYRQEMPKRLPALERSAERHRGEPASDAESVAKKLTGKPKSCLDAGCAGPYERHVFAPSMDMGVYHVCAIVDGVHGLFYPLEPQQFGNAEEAEDARLARIYKALSDEQRLRILRLLREREMYAQEIVERTGLHQSIVSRHLAFMKAVGLLTARRQNNMKFFSINNDMREELNKTLELFAPRGAATAATG
jgi:DNA-binding transcriptional ArsR family regulator